MVGAAVPEHAHAPDGAGLSRHGADRGNERLRGPGNRPAFRMDRRPVGGRGGPGGPPARLRPPRRRLPPCLFHPLGLQVVWGDLCGRARSCHRQVRLPSCPDRRRHSGSAARTVAGPLRVARIGRALLH